MVRYQSRSDSPGERFEDRPRRRPAPAAEEDVVDVDRGEFVEVLDDDSGLVVGFHHLAELDVAVHFECLLLDQESPPALVARVAFELAEGHPRLPAFAVAGRERKLVGRRADVACFEDLHLDRVERDASEGRAGPAGEAEPIAAHVRRRAGAEADEDRDRVFEARPEEADRIVGLRLRVRSHDRERPKVDQAGGFEYDGGHVRFSSLISFVCAYWSTLLFRSTPYGANSR